MDKNIAMGNNDTKVIKVDGFVSKSYIRKRSKYYARKNRKVLNSFAIMISIVIALTIMACKMTDHTPEKYIQTNTEIVSVESGDTLSQLCENYVPDGMILDEYIDIVQEYNGMDNARIYPQQIIKMPIFYVER